LRRSGARAAEQTPDRQAQLTGKVVRLIEAAVPGAAGMERNRHDGRGAREQIRRPPHGERGERSGQTAAPAVLERVDQLAQAGVVTPGAARDLKRWRKARQRAQRGCAARHAA
jgi:hypothetical protein